MKVEPEREEEAPPQPSLHCTQLEVKDRDALFTQNSDQTLRFAFGAKQTNATSLWNLSSPNIVSTERLVTLDHIDESESEVHRKDSMGDNSLVAKLKEQAASADKALRLKALQVEEYERELEFVHAKLAQVERKNDQLRINFEQKLTQLEQNIHLRKHEPRVKAPVGQMRSLTGSLVALRHGIADLASKICKISREGKIALAGINTRLGEERTDQESLVAELKKAEEELLAAKASLQHKEEMEKSLEVMTQEKERFRRERDDLRNIVKDSLKTQEKILLDTGKTEVKVLKVQTRMSSISDKLEALKNWNERSANEIKQMKDQLETATGRLRLQTLKLGRLQARNAALIRKIAEKKSEAHEKTIKKPLKAPKLNQPKKSLRSQRTSLALAHHPCTTGRSLCPRRAHIEALKRSYGL